MNDKQIKLWIGICVVTLMLAGAAVSFFAQKNTFYKGLEPLDVRSAQASVLNADFMESEDIVSADTEILDKLSQLSPTETLRTLKRNETPQAEKIEPVKSFCGQGQIAALRNGKIIGCSLEKIEKKTPAFVIPAPDRSQGQSPAEIQHEVPSLPPAPKIKIIDTASPTPAPAPAPALPALPTCESQGFFTYTGPDRPGLLYGMCIQCPTQEFVLSGGNCASPTN